jgi:predicted metal-dependent hydrolase
LYKDAKKHFESIVEENELFKKFNEEDLGCIGAQIYVYEEKLEEERNNNQPLGFRFTEEVIELELNLYDLVEKQIEYLKGKIELFKNLTSNTSKQEYDEIEKMLLDILGKKEELLGIERTIKVKKKITDKKELKKFGRGELKKELEKVINEYKLQLGETVVSPKINLITRKLINEGWDAKESVIRSKFRNLGYSEELKSN